MSGRKLTEEDLNLWRQVARTTEKLFPDRPVKELPIAKSDDPAKEPKPVLSPFRVGQNSKSGTGANNVLPGLSSQLDTAPVRMDKKAFGRMKRGKLVPEGRIDLHGMTLDQAHPALTAFIMRAQSDRKRLVLVITGKGKSRDDGGPIPVRPGALRHNVPHWLSIPPLAQIVLQVSEAHGRHGGGGAYYVYLRRGR